jgi:hypothetical protein
LNSLSTLEKHVVLIGNITILKLIMLNSVPAHPTTT